MMQGVVNSRCEATLTVVVVNSNRQLQAINTVIDTGFSGFLSLPSDIALSEEILKPNDGFLFEGHKLIAPEQFRKALI